MSASVNIHPELRSIKAYAFLSNHWGLRAMQAFLSAMNALHRRNFKPIVTRGAIPAADGYSIPVLFIRPENLRPDAPVLVYYHGGSFVMKPAPQHLQNAVRYAREAECLVIFVEYRLAPRHPFPTGFEDCHSALRWVISNAQTLGIDKQRIAVGGDSSGGGLAAGVVQRAVHEDGVCLCAQLLIYPAVDLTCTRHSTSAYASVPPFKNLSNVQIAEIYLGRTLSAGVPPYASPIYGDVGGLPPAYVEIPEFDVLHDQGNDYARALLDRGVEVELNEIKGGVHAFDLLAAPSTVALEAMQRRVKFLRRVFGRR